MADPSVLAVKVDAAATLQAARRAGRSGNPVEQTFGTVLRRIRPDEVPLHVTYSEAGLDGVLDGWQREAASGGVEGDLQFSGTQVVEVAPQRGIGIDREDAERRLVKELRTPGDDPVVLPVGKLEPQISRAEVARAAAQRARAADRDARAQSRHRRAGDHTRAARVRARDSMRRVTDSI